MQTRPCIYGSNSALKTTPRTGRAWCSNREGASEASDALGLGRSNFGQGHVFMGRLNFRQCHIYRFFGGGEKKISKSFEISPIKSSF